MDIFPHLIPNARLSITSSLATVSYFRVLMTAVDKLIETGRSPHRHREDTDIGKEYDVASKEGSASAEMVPRSYNPAFPQKPQS